MAKRHLYIQWDSTDNCNLKCSHCYHGIEGNECHIQRRDAMNLEDAVSMMDDLKITAERWDMVPRIAISGGEPLMRGDHLKILEYASEQNVITNLLTNGTLITPKKAKEIKERRVETVQVSIDGGKELHNSIRGRDYAYDKSLEGINNSYREGIKVTVAMTLMKSNHEEFEDVIKSAISAGATKVGFKTYVPDPIMGEKDPNYLNASEVYKVIKNTESLIEKYEDKIQVLKADVLWQILQEDVSLIDKAKEENKYLCGCSAGFRMLSVLSDGTVYPCRRLPIEIGNIREGISKLIIENDVMQELRDLDKMRENSLCDKVVHCRGCRGVAYAVTGDYMAKDPMCFKDLIKND